MNDTGLVVDCVSLDGQLGRIEVTGEGAFQILRKILHPLPFSGNSSNLKNCSTAERTNACEVMGNSILGKEEFFSSHSVVSLKVVDPRLLSRKVVSTVPDAHLARNLCGLSEDNIEESLPGSSYEKDDVISTLRSKNENNYSLSNSQDL